METHAIKLPDIGEGITQAEIVEWHVKIGDLVREDDPLVSVMTDKTTVEIPSLYSGRIVHLGGEIGDLIAVGGDLVVMESDQPADMGEGGAGPAAISEPSALPLSAPAGESPTDVQPSQTSETRSAMLASPAVRAQAKESGIDLTLIAGTGPGGRVTQSDLDAAIASSGKGPGKDLAKLRVPRTGITEIKVTGLRRTIAERMAQANARVAHITVVEEVDVTALEDLRDKLNLERGQKPKLTLLPFVTAALCRAFAHHPEMNAHFDDEAGIVTRFEAAHIGIATMTDAGLVVPVLRHAEAKGLFATAEEIARLSTAAREGRATRDELGGSTFTISSLGPLGALATTPIINLPEVAILGINKIATRPMWDGQQFVPRKMMNLSASFDHRIIDGWDAAVFVGKLKSLLETPALIFLDPSD